MELEIGGLDAGDPVEGNVEHAVQDEPDDVQRQEVEVQANHAFEQGKLGPMIILPEYMKTFTSYLFLLQFS